TPRPRASAARGGSRYERRAPGQPSRSPPRSSRRESEQLELEHFGARFLERPTDRRRRVVDPLLVDEDVRAEEALVEHAVDNLLARLLGLRLHLVRVEIDLALRLDDLLGHVLAADPARPQRDDLHAELAAEIVITSAHVHERTELVRRRMRVRRDAGAVDR